MNLVDRLFTLKAQWFNVYMLLWSTVSQSTDGPNTPQNAEPIDSTTWHLQPHSIRTRGGCVRVRGILVINDREGCKGT